MTVSPIGQARQSTASTVKTASQPQTSKRAPPRHPAAQQYKHHQNLGTQEFQPSIQEYGNVRITEVSQEKKLFKHLSQ